MQLYSADIRVRTYITKVPEETIYTISDEQITRNYSFELALCFKLGFGVDRNPEYGCYLKRSEHDHSDLQDELEQLKDSQLVYRNKTYFELVSRGYISMPTIQEQSTKREE